MKKAGLIFDLDGTLWDATQPVAESWQEVCREMIRPDLVFSAEDAKALMGLTMVEIGQKLSQGLLSGSDFEAFMKRCFDYEVEYLSSHPGAPYPIEIEVLTQLKEQGYRLFIVSNCQLGYIENYLACVPPLFEGHLCYGDTQREKSFTISKMMEIAGLESAIYIGDTTGDEKAAHGAGIPFVFARYGFGNSDHHEAAIDSFAQLPDAIAAIESTFLVKEE